MSDTIPGISIPDDLFDQHFGGGDATDLDEGGDTVEEQEDPEAQDDALPGGDADDTPEDEDEESDDPDPDGDPDDTGDEPDDDGEQEQGAADDDGPFDRTELARLRAGLGEIKDPAARAVAEKALHQAELAVKGFQRAYTKATTSLAEERKEWRGQVEEAREWQESHREWLKDLGTDAGRETFLLSILERLPNAFSEDVLVTAAMNDPDAFAAALERAQELEGDRKARRGFEKERDDRAKEHRGRQDDAAEARRQQAERERIIGDLVEDEATKAGVRKPESREVVRDSVDAMLARAARDGRRVSQEDVRAHVRKISAQFAREKADAEKAAERRARVRSQDQVKQQAKKAKEKRPTPAGQSAPKQGGEWQMPEKEGDVFGAAFDRFFG